MLANVLIGIGDSCLHIEIYNYVGKLYPNNSPPAFAVFKFTRVMLKFPVTWAFSMDKHSWSMLIFFSEYRICCQFLLRKYFWTTSTTLNSAAILFGNDNRPLLDRWEYRWFSCRKNTISYNNFLVVSVASVLSIQHVGEGPSLRSGPVFQFVSKSLSER